MNFHILSVVGSKKELLFLTNENAKVYCGHTIAVWKMNSDAYTNTKLMLGLS